ncbi:MAG: COX15/CtaA family protein [Burkholderiales bacterium]
MQRSSRETVAYWLLICCALVFAMVVVGGVTRLTKSGLSIVEWEPLMGAIPPLSESHWQELFQEYQRSPEYLKVNQGMSLDAFKGIFWWEYFHRLLGRLIGAVFFFPLLYFIVRKRIERSLVPKLFGIFLLGALQGAVGWWMVKSGLVDDPRVSQFRLTVHLGLAFLIFAAMFWTALRLLKERGSSPRPLSRYAGALCVLIFIMVLSGGLVAGTHAGLAYNTFPSMNGHLVPPEAFELTPWWKNFFYTVGAVQFLHRCIAWSLFVLVPWFWWRSHKLALAPSARLALNLFLAMLFVQIGLGIGTLLMHVPVPLATTHQAGAMLFFALSLLVAAELRFSRPSTSRSR